MEIGDIIGEKKGKRVAVPTQLSFKNTYLYTGIEVSTGKSFHLNLLNKLNGENIKIFLEKMKEDSNFKDSHLIIVWDRASFHRNKFLSEIKDIKSVLLPAYCPDLNPAERFFEELRRETANMCFDSLYEISSIIENKINKYSENEIKSLCNWDWIRKQSIFSTNY